MSIARKPGLVFWTFVRIFIPVFAEISIQSREIFEAEPIP